MNHLNTLTGERKIMNMAKLGTVAQSKSRPAEGANPRKQRADGMTSYTLCVFQGVAKRNSFRNSYPRFGAFRLGGLGRVAACCHPRCRDLRKAGDMSRKQAADVLDVAVRTIQNWEAGVALAFLGWPTACCASLPVTLCPARHGKTGQFTGTGSMPPMAVGMKPTASNRLNRSSG